MTNKIEWPQKFYPHDPRLALPREQEAFNKAIDACKEAYAKAEGQELVPLGYSAISKWLISEFGFENEYIIRQLCEKFGQPKPNIPSVEELTYHITKFFYEFECESNIVYSKDLAKAIHALIVEKVEK